ncbi:MYND-type domain-containing protein [Mycena sanguinolenta]|uniref:MYND-type domain-containing protein n=1 Tax=Mycena sanguinolenta TaxID=230812 RepID=A0A8H6ZBL7_9AGAR|nr:MYND-type domain-containing protein [Mycena sanguinolenta]
MHPALSVSNFARLPPALRMRANIAVSGVAGSQEETVALVDDLPDISSEHLPYLLPVLHSALDPVGIPAVLARFDSLGWESIKWDIMRAHSCLRGLLVLGFQFIPTASFADLWRNIWPWIAFLDENEENFSCADFGNVRTRYRAYMSVMRFMNTDEAANQLVHTTPGLYVVVGRAWRHLLEENSGGLLRLSYVLGETVRQLVAVICLVDSGVVPEHRRRRNSAIQDAFRSCGIVATLTTASRALCKSSLDIAEFLLRTIFLALLDHIVSFPPLWLNESLRAGLLDIVFTYHPHRALAPPVRRLLEDILIPAAVYHSVLVQLRICFAQVRDRDAENIFDNGYLLKIWGSLLEVAQSRFQILDEYNNDALVTTRACDSVACARICSKHALKRCSGCLSAYYCSQKCQTNDWQHGGHRRICDDLSSRQKLHYSRNSIRDWSFLRALLYHEYARRQEEIARKRLLFVERHPDEIPCTVFDFMTPGCEVVVGPLKVVGYLFRFEAEKMSRCGGTMHLNLMKVIGDADVPRLWPFPVHVKSVGVDKGRRVMESSLDELE